MKLNLCSYVLGNSLISLCINQCNSLVCCTDQRGNMSHFCATVGEFPSTFSCVLAVNFASSVCYIDLKQFGPGRRERPLYRTFEQKSLHEASTLHRNCAPIIVSKQFYYISVKTKDHIHQTLIGLLDLISYNKIRFN